jgi:hypothetical protein
MRGKDVQSTINNTNNEEKIDDWPTYSQLSINYLHICSKLSQCGPSWLLITNLSFHWFLHRVLENEKVSVSGLCFEMEY